MIDAVAVLRSPEDDLERKSRARAGAAAGVATMGIEIRELRAIGKQRSRFFAYYADERGLFSGMLAL